MFKQNQKRQIKKGTKQNKEQCIKQKAFKVWQILIQCINNHFKPQWSECTSEEPEIVKVDENEI